MAGYEYGNARVRAMKSRLFSVSQLDLLAESGSQARLIAALAATEYRRSVEMAVVLATDMAVIAELLVHNLVATLSQVRAFYSGQERDAMSIALNIYDVHNVKTILRGLSQNIDPGELVTALLPIGDLTTNLLSTLIRGSEPRAAIDLLASMRLPIAQPLLELRGMRPGAAVVEMEQALDQWYFVQVRQYVRRMPRAAGVLGSALALDADIANLMTVLRFAHTPAERHLFHEQPEVDDLRSLLLGPGTLSFEILERMGSQGAVEDAVDFLSGTMFAVPLKTGLIEYKQSDRLSDLERALRRYRLHWLAGLITKDPLGMGVPLGYFALKHNEVRNIRTIAWGINLGLDSSATKTQLELLR